MAARTAEQRRAIERADAGSPGPLVALTPLGAAPRGLPALPGGGLPAAGVKVLDLTRVIAGPVGTRMLGSSVSPG